MRCFWRRGYELTSIRDLTGAMRITSASLYNAFGNKRSLYRRALGYYLEQSVRDRVWRLAPLPPYSAIRAFFDEIVERSVTDKQRRGCMLVNAALEIAPIDAEFQKTVVDEMLFIEEFFRRCVASGQRDGTITSKRPADELAKVLLSVLLGVRVLARTRPQRVVLESAVYGALSLLKSEA
jgi:TetR/AcrR family transcriptional repressor of nem operon